MADSHIGKRLLQARLDLAQRLGREVPKSEIAKMVGIPAPTYGRYENGGREPEIALIPKLARALETTPEWLAAGEQGPRRKRGPILRKRKTGDEETEP